MTLLTRISRLFKADLHGILDNLEEPEMILKQAVRDMREELDKAAAAISVLNQQQERLQQKKQIISQQVEEIQQHLRFCLREQNEKLAKSVIRKKLQTERSLAELSRHMTSVTEQKELKIAETEERKEKLQAIRDKLTLFTEHSRFDDDAPPDETEAAVSDDDVELAYLYEKQRYGQGCTEGETS